MSDKQVKKRFQWRDREGNWHYPENMSTKHLFFTLRMIWNHSVTDEFQIEPFRRYNFGATYTQQYMAEAVTNICKELSKRNDLTNYYRYCLGLINTWCSTFSLEDHMCIK